MNEPTQTIHATPLPFLGVLRVAGADATAFLQGQLTNDVRLLDDGRTQLAGYNTPQGRVIALLRLRKVDNAIYALLPAELLDLPRATIDGTATAATVILLGPDLKEELPVLHLRLRDSAVRRR